MKSLALEPEVMTTMASDAGRADLVRRQLQALGGQVRTAALQIGALLWEAREQRYARQWQAVDLESWVERELGLSPRTARDLMANYERFVVRLRIEADALTKLGWSKLAIIRRVVDESNHQRWIGWALECNEKELKARVSAALPDAPDDEGDWEDRKLSLPKDVWKHYDACVAAAKIEHSVTNVVTALEAVFLDYLDSPATNGNGKARRELIATKDEQAAA